MTKKTNINQNFDNQDWWKTATLEDVLNEISKGADLNHFSKGLFMQNSFSYAMRNKTKERFEILKTLVKKGAEFEHELPDLFAYYSIDEAIYFLEQASPIETYVLNSIFSYLIQYNRIEPLKYILNRYQDVIFTLEKTYKLARIKDKDIISIFLNKVIIPHKEELNLITAIVSEACKQENAILLNVLLDKVFTSKFPENICDNILTSNALNRELILKFLEKGVDKNLKDSHGRTLLNQLTDIYCQRFNPEETSLISIKEDILYWIDYGMDVNIPSNNGSTPLLNMCSATVPSLEIISKLISKGADVNVKRKDYVKIKLSELYRAAPTDNDTPLYNAINKSANTELIHLLLDSGANVNAYDRNNDVSIIDIAIKRECNTETIDKILKSGINDYYKKRGFLRLIRQGGSFDIFNVFINNGIDINEKFTGYVEWVWWCKDYTPLMMACYCGNLDYVKLLIDLGADINVKDEKGRSLLSIACLDTFPEPSLIEFLIKLGFDVNEQDDEGNTPLMISYQNGDLASIFNVLIKNGADINKRNHNGDNILLVKYYPINSRTNIDRVCVKHGADVTVVNNNGKKVNEYYISLHEELFDTIIDRKKIDKEVENKLKNKEAKQNSKINTSNLFKNKVVCFAGFKNKKLSDYIKSHGGKYVTSLTDDCNLLIRKHQSRGTTSEDSLVREAIEKVIKTEPLCEIENKIQEYGDIEQLR